MQQDLLFPIDRNYDPASGQFTQQDPIGIAGGANVYGFAGGDPVNFSDPFGLCPPEWMCKLIGASAGESAVEFYAGVATNPSSSRGEKAAATVGGVFAALWTPDTYNATAAVLSGGMAVAAEVPAINSIPASGPRINAAEQRAVNEIGARTGCQTCGAGTPGTKSGNWVGDHQPPTAMTKHGQSQTLSPQCLKCSRIQGGQVRQATRKAGEP